eukprot:EW703893.1.p1 GENE.EW703893.1~~EW703893.1.p1  ORF type:complete len:88 (+),score=37.22 EW703893.1:50-313(+)
MAAKPAGAAAVIAEAVKVDKSKLEHVTPAENNVVNVMKTHNAIVKKDKSTLHHVESPKAGLTEAQKAAFKEDREASKKGGDDKKGGK